MQLANTADVRKMLAETIKDVRSGSVDAKKANAISALTGKIIATVRLDMEVMRLTSKDSKSIKGRFGTQLLTN